MNRFFVTMVWTGLLASVLIVGYIFLKTPYGRPFIEKIEKHFAQKESGSAEKPEGNSGLPTPRFVSLKTDRVNVRRGPSTNAPLLWTFTARDLPVEIIGEYEQWRRIRDSEGTEGWVSQTMLSGKRTALLTPWQKDKIVTLYHTPSKDSGVALYARSGTWGKVEACHKGWCLLVLENHKAWIEQAFLFGVYPNETIE